MNIFGPIIAGIWIAFWLYWAVSALRNRSRFKRSQSRASMLLLILALIAVWAIFADLLPAGLLEEQVIPAIPFACPSSASTSPQTALRSTTT